MTETPQPPPDEFQPPPVQPSGQEPYGSWPGAGQAWTPPGQESYGEPATAGQPWPPPGQPAPVDLRTVTGPAPILVGFAGRRPQARLTVLFRAILAIPHVVVLAILGIAAFVVAFLGWWAALFTGQLPEWAHSFLTSWTRWTARLQAYLYFLTDQYPPFALEDADYPVRLFAKRTRLNRAAVFFRFILVIPAYIIAGVAGIGLFILSIGAWLITLITGQLPAGLHEAFTALVRYSARYSGYAFLITPDQPWHGLYGDQAPALAPGWAAGGAPAGAADAPVYGTAADSTATAAADGPDADATTADATTGDATTGDATTADGPIAPGAEPSFGFGAAADAPSPAPDPWRLVLSSTGRLLVTVALIVGAIGFAGDIAWQSSRFANTTGDRISAFNAVNGNYSRLDAVLKAFQTKTDACGQSISCVTALDSQVATAFKTFGTGLQNAGIPSSYSADANALASENGKVQADFGQLAAATSVTQYENIVSGLNLDADLTAWQLAYNKLASSLDRP